MFGQEKRRDEERRERERERELFYRAVNDNSNLPEAVATCFLVFDLTGTKLIDSVECRA